MSAANPNRDRQRADLPGAPLAYFLTFRTYASWLHGDERGSVDREHNTPDTPMLPPDPRREEAERRLAQSGPVILDREHRRIVHRTIVEVCAHNAWTIYELSVRSNHVHVVVAAPQKPEHVMRSIKSWTTRRLREANLSPVEASVWSRHGSTRYLWKAEALDAACRYVLDAQGEDI
ncbi:MAG TPA: transposase [Phycisphaerae bacterium]|nr:transposase [Phycisphaerae bacterium]